jgi:hypothetical protein
MLSRALSGKRCTSKDGGIAAALLDWIKEDGIAN